MVWENACIASSGTASQLFTTTLNFLAATQCFVPDKVYPDDTLTDSERFHFIIVGGGTAGSILANRLSENSDWNIALLEAGPEPPAESVIPNMDSTLYESKYDWNYLTKSDGKTNLGLRGGSVHWPRGKMLGGSSSINAMYYVRGQDHDFQTWYDEGNPSWSPENVNYYFKKAENFQDMKLNEDPEIYETYGHDGPFVINTFNHTYSEVGEKILDSFDYIGIKKVRDINAAKFEGNGVCAISRAAAANGQRQSTYQAYLNPARARPNLKIVTNAFVTKILLDESSSIPRANGVELEVNGKKKKISADLEVILSAGAINSPQLLMLSGIGPKKHLLSKNIPCKVNSPRVGKNLQDHPYIPIPVCGDEPVQDMTANSMFDVVKYLYDKTGYLAHDFLMNLSIFFSLEKDMSYPEFQSHLLIFARNSSNAKPYFRKFTDDVADSITQCNADQALIIFAFHPLHPLSRGLVYLNSSNPHEHPIIDPKYNSDERDVQAAADGIQMLTNILNAPYFKSINAAIPKVNLPQCDEFEFLSNDYWKCYIIHMTQTVFHPVGTAKMGKDPKHSVVDNYMKVYGVEGLRVIDGSIMPYLTSGNTMSPVIMIGEMGSDMIKNEYLQLNNLYD